MFSIIYFGYVVYVVYTDYDTDTTKHELVGSNMKG